MADHEGVDSLKSLERKHSLAVERVKALNQELAAAQEELEKLYTAVEAVRAVLGLSPETPEEQHRKAPDAQSVRHPNLADSAVAETRRSEVPERLQKYLPTGGTRLRSKLMVFDLLQRIGEPITRERLQREFFDYYGRDVIEQYWQRPNNALNTAIDRARDEDLILQIEGTNGGPPLYTVNFRDSKTGLPAHYKEEGDG